VLLVNLGELLLGAEQESLLLREDVNVLDAVLKLLAGAQEERGLALADLLGAELLALGSERVEDDAVLAVAEGGELHLADELLVDVANVDLGVLRGDEPLFTSLAGLAADVDEGAGSTDVKGSLVGEDVSIDLLDDVLVDAGKVGARFAH